MPTAEQIGNAVYSLTVRDAAGSLSSQICDGKKRLAEGGLDDTERRELQALICIDARTAFLALLEFLSLEFGIPVDKEVQLVAEGREKGLQEVTIINDELQSAMEVLTKLSNRLDDDPYLQSVAAKFKKVNGS